MKIDFDMSDDTTTMTVSERENGIASYSCKVHGFEPATGLKRFFFPDYDIDEPVIEKADDLAGFVLVDPADLPLRTRFYALLTNSKDVTKAAYLMNEHKGNRTWTEFYNDCKQQLRLELPPLFRLGVIAKHKRLPLWAQPIEIVEENPHDRSTIGYWPGYRRTEKLRWYSVLGEVAFTTVHYELEELEGLSKVFCYSMLETDWEEARHHVAWKYFHAGVVIKDRVFLYVTKQLQAVEQVARECFQVQAGDVASGKKILYPHWFERCIN